MARKYKKREEKKAAPEPVIDQEVKTDEPPKPVPVEEIPPKITESSLPMKDLFRVNEAADYFMVTERTIFLWITHGILIGRQIGGTTRISREDMLKCSLGAEVKLDREMEKAREEA